MDNKEVVSANKMVWSLIGYWLLWGIGFGLIYGIVYSKIVSNIESIVVSAIIAIVLQGIMVVLLWKTSTSFAFNRKTVLFKDVSYIMKRLIVFTIIVCAIDGGYKILQIDSEVNKRLEYNYEFRMTDNLAQILYDDEEISQYNKQKEDMIKDTKTRITSYIAIYEIGVTITYLLALTYERKQLLKYVVCDY